MGKIDKKKMEQMLRAGMSLTAVAEYFGVTPSAVCQQKAKLKNLVVRSMALEKAHEVVSSHLDVVGQLQRINDAINDELEKAQKEAKKAQGSKKIPFQRLIVELSAEVRKQLDAQLKIFELWHDVQVIREFQEEVLNILDEVEPGARDAIITKLKQRRAIRSTVQFN